MKICISTDSWTPLWGGGQEHIWQTSKRLVEKYGCQVDILAPNLLPKAASQANIYRLGPPFIFPNFFGRLGYLYANFKFQIAHSYDIYHSQSHDTLFLVPFVKLFRPKAKYVYTIHGQPNTPLKWLWNLMVFHFPFDALLTAAKISAPSAFVIGNGVDVSEIDKIKTKKNKNVFTIIWAGREGDKIKGVRILKQAFEIIHQKYPLMKLKIVSGKPHQEVLKELKSSDLFVLPSLSEGLPLVILEAMAAKLPVVTTDVGDCGDLIEKSGAGLVVKPGDAEQLATAIESIYKNHTNMGSKGHDYVKKNYNWDEITKHLWNLYQKLDQLQSATRQ